MHIDLKLLTNVRNDVESECQHLLWQRSISCNPWIYIIDPLVLIAIAWLSRETETQSWEAYKGEIKQKIKYIMLCQRIVNANLLIWENKFCWIPRGVIFFEATTWNWNKMTRKISMNASRRFTFHTETNQPS